VIGSLSGFESPVNLSAVRRVRMEKPGRLAHKDWFIGMRDTPLSIAEAVREMDWQGRGTHRHMFLLCSH
jgi:hypothetical protein